ncbi:MAG: RNA-binding protein [Prevotellaceae bacterium]|jgi:RNA recognition motif-containing protein|nr:RNA-binding protein [Prevotellaceae bacterium]
MNIFVSSLSFKSSNEDLKRLFEAYGEVSSARIITDRDSRRSKGYGFVEMPNDQEGEAAINALNGSEQGGRTINVSVAREREQRSY